VRAPSTLGSFLRSFTWGNVRQLEAAGRELLAGLARRVPLLLPGAGQLAFVDIDSMQRRVYGHAKQGAAFGHTKIQGKTVLVRGLNALAATISTPQAAPVVAATRLRGGNANTARGAASFTAEAIGTARASGCAATIVARADSGLYCAAFTSACRRAGAHFSVTARMDPAVKAAIASIPEDAWTPIRYPRAIWDDQLAAWVPAPRSPRPATRHSPRRRARRSPPGCLASGYHARARGTTIRRDLIDVAARTARHGRGHLTLHLPEGWHRQAAWLSLFQAGCGPPPARAA
jgi:hypothetical protein